MAISDERLEEIAVDEAGCWTEMDDVEAEQIVAELRSYREAMARMKALGLDRWEVMVKGVLYHGSTPLAAIEAAWAHWEEEQNGQGE